MSPKTDTEVLIGGKVFTLSGYESEDYMQKIWNGSQVSMERCSV